MLDRGTMKKYSPRIIWLILVAVIFLLAEAFVKDPSVEKTKKKLARMQVEAEILFGDVKIPSARTEFQEGNSSLTIFFKPTLGVKQFVHDSEEKLLKRGWRKMGDEDAHSSYCKDQITLDLLPLLESEDEKELLILMSYSRSTVFYCF